MLKIKYITNVRIPSPRAQAYAIMKMCEEFGRASADVELIIPERKHSEIREDPFKYYKIEEKFRINRVKSIDLLGPFFVFGKLFYWVDIISFLCSLFFRKIVVEGYIVYTRDFLIPTIFSRKNFVCLELHEIPTSKFLFKFLIKKPKLFFVLNQNIKNILIGFGVPTEKIHIAPSGVDLNEFKIALSQEEARTKLGLQLDKKTIVYTGHLYKWKGVGTLAEAAKKLPEYTFVFVGGVSPQIDEFKKNFGSYSNIVIHPFQERNMMPLYNAAADVVVIPNSQYSNISSSYTSPLKLFEYMASKKPIIVSDLPSMREVLNEKNCFFAEADNPESFAEVIKKVIENSELSVKAVETAFQDVQKYSWTKRAQNILQEISNISQSTRHDILAE